MSVTRSQGSEASHFETRSARKPSQDQISSLANWIGTKRGGLSSFGFGLCKFLNATRSLTFLKLADSLFCQTTTFDQKEIA